MSSRTDPVLAEDMGLELMLLCDALDMSTRGGFLFAVCEEGPLRERLMRQVRDHLQAEDGQALIAVELSPEHPDLAGQLEQLLLYEGAPEKERVAVPVAVRDRPRPPAVFIHTHGLAEPRDEAAVRALRALNFQRERLGRLEVPLVFWLSQNTLGQVVQHAADLFAARSGIFYFEAPLREPTAPPPMRPEAVTDLLDRFHRTLLPPEELRKRAALYERRLEQQLRPEPVEGQAAEAPNWPRIAFLCRDLANIHRELDDYARAGTYQDEAIEAYQKAIAAQESEGKGPEWANLHSWLGLAYARRIRGERAENLEQAIGYYRRALEVRTRQDFPVDWATTQNNLGIAYANRIRGERAENLERAIDYYQRALEVVTRQDFPERWAMTQNNLGIACAERIRGERAENIEQAIGHFQRALEVYNRQDFPADWAMTQNNLGNAYAYRIRGERAENLEHTIKCYNDALSVWTAEAFPHHHEAVVRNLEQMLSQSRPPLLRKRIQAALRRIRHTLRLRKSERLPKS